MKSWKPLLVLLGLALNVSPARAQQQTNDAQQKALEMLRQMTAERERRRGAIAPAPTNAPAKADLSFAEIEQQYLQGKITARQFQKYLQDHKIAVPAKGVAPAETDALALEILRRETAKVAAESAKAPDPAKPDRLKPEVTLPEGRTDTTTTGPDQTALTEVERKMDELLRLKAAREQAALTNAPAAPATNSVAAAAPKPKRQRLDELLKLYIDGKLSEAEYNEKRSKIIAEP